MDPHDAQNLVKRTKLAGRWMVCTMQDGQESTIMRQLCVVRPSMMVRSLPVEEGNDRVLDVTKGRNLMRRLFSICALLALLNAGIACKHVGGKCDCGPGPGDATTYHPTGNVAAPVTPTQSSHVIGGTPIQGPIHPSAYEPIGAPKTPGK